MTTRSLLSLPLGLVLLALPGVYLLDQASPPAVANTVTAPGSSQDDEPLSLADYKAAIQAAAKKFDTRTIESLLKKRLEFGQRTAVDLLENVAWRPNERNTEEIKPFRAAWKEAFDDNFLRNVERGLSRMPGSLRKKRNQLIVDFDTAYTIYQNLEGKKPGKERNLELKSIGSQLEQMGDAMLEVGELYFATLAHYYAAVANHAERVGDDQDLALVARSLTKMIETRERLGLADDDKMPWARAVVEELAAAGVTPGAVGAGEPGTVVTPAYKFGPARTFTGEFRALEDPVEVLRPGYSNDAAYVTWNLLSLRRIGSTITFSAMSDSPKVTRTKEAEFEVEGTDGTTSSYQVTGRVTLVETTAGDPPHPFAFLVQTGTNQDYFHEVLVNLQPNVDFLGLYSLPAAGITIDIDDTPLTVFDDNADGLFGSVVPLTFNYVGVTSGEFQPDIDTVLIGKSKRAVPFSEFMLIGKTWSRLEPQVAGTSFRVSPIEDLKTGELALKFDGPKPDWMIVRGEGSLETCYFDLTASRKVEVPVGRYVLYYGGFREGERADGIRKAMVIPGKSPSSWAVKEGEVTDVELGKPFDIDFKFTANSSRVTVLGESLTVTGKAGERYHRLWNLRLSPEVQIRKGDKGKGTKFGRMQLISDQNTLNDEGFNRAWKPLDMEVENRFSTDAVEVRLVEKKNKLFGKLESSWRSLN